MNGFIGFSKWVKKKLKKGPLSIFGLWHNLGDILNNFKMESQNLPIFIPILPLY
jgi:hypothetical protein